MSDSPTGSPSDAPPGNLQTAEEIAAFLNVDPKTVLNWAKAGIIPEAFRVGRTVRFAVDDVLASLNVGATGDGRSVELVVLALSLAIGPEFPRIPKVDLDSVTLGEVETIKRLVAAYVADLDTLESAQEVYAYAEGVLEAARQVARLGLDAGQDAGE